MYKKHILVATFLIAFLIFSTLVIFKPSGEEPPCVKASPVSSYTIC